MALIELTPEPEPSTPGGTILFLQRNSDDIGAPMTPLDTSAMVNIADDGSPARLAGIVRSIVDDQAVRGPINVLAIGSDRTTGDCLGPLVGEFLQGTVSYNVYGTLTAPVHAANMREIVPEITGFTIAIDAALGDPVGGVAVRTGSIAPGAAFGRDLPRVGNIAISALVCEAGPLGFERLRSVRLGYVRDLAHMIATALCSAVDATAAANESAWADPMIHS